jgi:elongation factor P hydroxylase
LLTENLRLASVVTLFEQLFYERLNTRLLGGAEEPIYIPAGLATDDADISPVETYHRLYFRHDYLSSALHETAHWCIAGTRRREQLDFGYWYSPDGRSSQQQQLFEQAEVAPQALEWMFSIASGQRFRVSADNLASDEGASDDFVRAVAERAQSWCAGGNLPSRGRLFIEALGNRFDCAEPLSQDHYRLEALV